MLPSSLPQRNPQLSVNYSAAAAELLKARRIDIDRFKCPAWPDLVSAAQKLHPVYVHFPLKVGSGNGSVVNSETHSSADWGAIETLMRQTQTPYLNLHLSPSPQDYPGIDIADTSSAQGEKIVEGMMRDVEVAIGRFGRDRVLLENDHANGGRHLKAGYLPAVIARVVAETNCGFLLDLSHARLSARALNMSDQDYVSLLPLSNIREIHITGLQRFDQQWIGRLRKAHVADTIINDLDGRLMDHLPMTPEDWMFLSWALDHIRAGRWGNPWVVAFEYGGVGELWEAVTDIDILAEQLPKMCTLLMGMNSPGFVP